MSALSHVRPQHPASAHPELERNPRILVVDDNEAIHVDFQKILSPQTELEGYQRAEAAFFGRPQGGGPRLLDFELSFALQGAQALELVRGAMAAGRRYALVFMDVRMPPGWDGLETILKLWEVDADLQVVICTAYSDKSWEEMMVNLPHPERVLILKKPFDPIEVLQLASALTEKWSLLQGARRNTEELERTVSERTHALVAANARLEAEIAKHKAANERISEQAMLLEAARDAIIVRDLEGKILFWNQGAERVYGWSAREALGRDVVELLYSGLPTQALSAARQALLKEGSWMGELHQKTKHGHHVTAACHWTLVRDEAGAPKSVLAINSDVTEKKLLEAKFLRAQRLESIGTLAGGIAHDLNNILQPITLAMGIFRTQLPDSSRGILDLVTHNAQRATSLVKQVLSFAHGVEGQRAPVDPNALAHDIASIVQETFPKNLRLELHPARAPWPFLGDSTQLHQVLLNLCVNARDAMPAGGTLTLAVENVHLDEREAATQTDATPGPHVVLSVTDTGTGIREALWEKIWDPFFTTKATGEGSGLGLPTTLSIVRSHGGFISMRSQEGHGTTFRVFVPAAQSAPESTPDSHQGAPSDPPSALLGHGELILVVDDEAPLNFVMCQALQFFGYQVLSAANGAEGMRVYAQHSHEIKAVIADMIMPVMDGSLMIASLKALDADLKIIATTGMSSNASLERITRLGVQRIIAKPCAINTLLVALRDVLQA